MKNNFTILIFLFVSSLLSAQCEIDNPSFETWTDQPVEVESFNGDVFANDVSIPDSTTTVVRLLFQAFGVLFDPAIGQQLVDDPQGFIGFSQSDDATDGMSALRLQGTDDLSVADIYSPNDCTMVPDSFHFDVKHENSGGLTDDTLIVFMTFDLGLSPLPEDSTQLMDSPYSAYGEFIYDADTEYHTISLPINENFQQEVDTFYYLILSATHDGSSFLIDNLRFTEEGGSDCFFDAYPAFTIESEIEACFCNGLPENILLDTVALSEDYDVMYVVVDEDNFITEVSETNSSFFEQDFCFEDAAYLVEIRYTELAEVNTGMFLSDLNGCFALSERKEITGSDQENFDFNMSVDGIPILVEDILLCLADDVIEVFQFEYDTDRMASLLLMDDDNIIIDQFDIFEAQTFEELEPGNTYLIGMIAHDEPLPNYIGLDLFTLPLIFDQCIAASGNSFNIIVAENNTGDCISNTQDSDILGAIEIVENPVSDHLRIEIGQFSGNQLSFQVYNINGQAINKSQIINDQQTIEMDLNHIPGGIYFLNVRSDKGQASFKFLKI